MGKRSNGPLDDDNLASAGTKLTSAKFRFYDAIIADTTLTGLDRRVAWQLLHYFNEAYGYAWPSHARLAKDLGCTDRAALRSVQRLVEGNWFSKRSGGGRGQANEYVPNWKKTLTGESGFTGEKANKPESEQETLTGESKNPDSRVRKPRPASHPTSTITPTMKKTKARGGKNEPRAAASLARSPDGGSLRFGASRACKKEPATIGEVLAPMLKDSSNGKDAKTRCTAKKADTASPGEHERTEDGVNRKGQGGISMTGNGQEVLLLGPTGVIEGGAARQETEDAEALGMSVEAFCAYKAARDRALEALGKGRFYELDLDLNRRLKAVPADAREGVRRMEWEMWPGEQSAGSPTVAIAATATGSDV